MNSPDIHFRQSAPSVFDPQAVIGDFHEVKKSALKSLQESFRLVGNFSAHGPSSITSKGLQELETPTLNRNVNDMTLRIGLLQDALNQLMQQVSRTEIRQRMNELQKENQQQLDRFQAQMEKAAEAAKQAAEAKKKGNVFEAVSNWIQAVVSVVSAVFTLVAAAGQILTNPVGAAGLIVAGVALIGVAAVQVTLAVDATMRAAGQEGFLSDNDRKKMALASQILGYVAVVGSMVGLVGGVVVALGQAGRAAGQIAGQQIGRVAAAKMVATGMLEMAKGSANMSVSRVATYAFQESMKGLLRLGTQLAVTQIVGQTTNAATTGAGKLEVAELSQKASEAKAEADRAEAATKAIQAQVAKLRALIEQLQQELEHMVDEGQQTMSIIFGAIDESAESMTRIQQTTSA